MKRRILVALVVPLLLLGCNFASGARDTIATSYGYLTWAQSEYTTSCRANTSAPTCTLITRAIGLHNAGVDALNGYCNGLPKAGDQPWTNGGPCAPVKGMQGALQAALANLGPVIADLRLLATGKSQPKVTAERLEQLPDTMASLESVRLEVSQ
jgi:hypothetical protein